MTGKSCCSDRIAAAIITGTMLLQDFINVLSNINIVTSYCLIYHQDQHEDQFYSQFTGMAMVTSLVHQRKYN